MKKGPRVQTGRGTGTNGTCVRAKGPAPRGQVRWARTRPFTGNSCLLRAVRRRERPPPPSHQRHSSLLAKSSHEEEEETRPLTETGKGSRPWEHLGRWQATLTPHGLGHQGVREAAGLQAEARAGQAPWWWWGVQAGSPILPVLAQPHHLSGEAMLPHPAHKCRGKEGALTSDISRPSL